MPKSCRGMIDIWALHAPEFQLLFGQEAEIHKKLKCYREDSCLSSSTPKLVKFPLIMQLYTGYFSKDMPEAPYHSHKLLMLSLNCKSKLKERGKNLANVFYKNKSH